MQFMITRLNRLVGCRGQRVGEASHPGPMTELDDDKKLLGMAAEKACEYLAKKKRGRNARRPETVRIRSETGSLISTTGDTLRRKDRVKKALDRAVETMRTVFAALEWRHVHVRSAICPATLPGGRWTDVGRLNFRST